MKNLVFTNGSMCFSVLSQRIQQDSLLKNVTWGKPMKRVDFTTLLPYGEPTSGSHHGDLRAHSGQWAAPFEMLSEADGRDCGATSGWAGIIRSARLICPLSRGR